MDPLSSLEIYSAKFFYFDVSLLCFAKFFSLSASHILSNTDTLQLSSILKSQFPPSSLSPVFIWYYACKVSGNWKTNPVNLTVGFLKLTF